MSSPTSLPRRMDRIALGDLDQDTFRLIVDGVIAEIDLAQCCFRDFSQGHQFALVNIRWEMVRRVVGTLERRTIARNDTIEQTDALLTGQFIEMSDIQ